MPRSLREEVKTERARAILSAARDLFSEKGFEQTTTQEIAAHAGVGAGTVFKYFPSKDALLFAIVNMDLIAVHQQAALSVAVETELMPRLLSFYRQILKFHLANADLSRSFMRLLIPPTMLPMEPGDGEGAEGPVRTTIGFIAHALSAGELKPDVPEADLAENCFSIFLDVLNRALMLDPAMSDPYERLAQRLSLQIRPLIAPAR